MKDNDKFYLGLIILGNVLLVLGFIYCVSRYKLCVLLIRIDIPISHRIWLYWWWDRLFSFLFTLLRLDRLTVLQRPLRISPVEHIGTQRKTTGGHFAPSGAGLDLINVNGVYYVYNQYMGYEDYDEAIHEVKTNTSGHA